MYKVCIIYSLLLFICRNNDGFLIPVFQVDEADFLEGSSSYGLEL